MKRLLDRKSMRLFKFNVNLLSLLTLMVLGTMTFVTAAALAHPIGKGNCLPLYHTWRNATYAVRDAEAALTQAQANLRQARADAANALASGDPWQIAFAPSWIAIAQAFVNLKQSALATARAAVGPALEGFQNCDHY